MFTNKSFKSLKLHAFHFPLKPNCKERLFCVKFTIQQNVLLPDLKLFLLLLEVGDWNLPTKKMVTLLLSQKSPTFLSFVTVIWNIWKQEA